MEQFWLRSIKMSKYEMIISLINDDAYFYIYKNDEWFAITTLIHTISYEIDLVYCNVPFVTFNSWTHTYIVNRKVNGVYKLVIEEQKLSNEESSKKSLSDGIKASIQLTDEELIDAKTQELLEII